MGNLILSEGSQKQKKAQALLGRGNVLQTGSQVEKKILIYVTMLSVSNCFFEKLLSHFIYFSLTK